MTDPFKSRTMKRKNHKNLALEKPPAKTSAPSAGDAQIPGGIGNDARRGDTLEIGMEFRLDLRSEDLVVLKELGAGNGGTVSKVQHAATKVIMARKVRDHAHLTLCIIDFFAIRSYTSKQNEKYVSELCENFK